MNKLLYLFLIACFSIKVSAQTINANLEKYWKYRDRLPEFVAMCPHVHDNNYNWAVWKENNSKYQNQGVYLPVKGKYFIDGAPKLFWGDAPQHLANLIQVLATEYRLLKDASQSIDRTLMDLSNCLYTIERLDIIAEWAVQKNDGGCDDPGLQGHFKNGYFQRDDVDSKNKIPTENYFKNLDSKSIYEADYIHPNGVYDPTNIAASQDHVAYLLLGLALVKELVDDQREFVSSDGRTYTMRTWANKLADLMITKLQNRVYLEKPGRDLCRCRDPNYDTDYEKLMSVDMWFIRNPVSCRIPDFGNQFNMMQYSHYFGKAYAHFFNTEAAYGKFYNYSPPPLVKAFDKHSAFNVKLTLATIANGYPFETDHFNATGAVDFTAFIVNELKLPITSPYDAELYAQFAAATATNSFSKWKSVSGEYEIASFGAKWIRNKPNNEIKASYTREYSFEHLPFIYHILHGNSDFGDFHAPDASTTFLQHVVSILNSAPPCGPHLLKDRAKFDAEVAQGLASYDWISEDRNSKPHQLGAHTDRNSEIQEYNGLDYMLLHNLYYLVILEKYNRNEYFDNKNYPIPEEDKKLWWPSPSCIYSKYMKGFTGDFIKPLNKDSQKTLYLYNSFVKNTTIPACASFIHKEQNSGPAKATIIAKEIRLVNGFTAELATNITLKATNVSHPYPVYEPKVPSYTCASLVQLKSMEVIPEVPNEDTVMQEVKNNHEQLQIISPLNQLSIYPIPCSGELNIDYNGKKELANVVIVNVSNQVVSRAKFSSQQDVNHLPSGLYFIIIYDILGEVVYKQKLIITKE